jgi:hypothetical protein
MGEARCPAAPGERPLRLWLARAERLRFGSRSEAPPAFARESLMRSVGRREPGICPATSSVSPRGTSCSISMWPRGRTGRFRPRAPASGRMFRPPPRALAADPGSARARRSRGTGVTAAGLSSVCRHAGFPAMDDWLHVALAMLDHSVGTHMRHSPRSRGGRRVASQGGPWPGCRRQDDQQAHPA